MNTIQTDSQISQTFNLTNGLIFDKSSQNIDKNDNSIDTKVFTTCKPELPLVLNTNSCDGNPTTVQPVTEKVAQYLASQLI